MSLADDAADRVDVAPPDVASEPADSAAEQAAEAELAEDLGIAEAAVAQLAPEPIRAQVVDGLAMARRTVRLALRDYGIEVVIESESAVQAVEDFRSARPEVVTVDMTLPDMDGVQLVRALRRIDPDVRAVLLSSCDASTLERERLHAGACAVVTKPVDPAKLATALRAARELPEAPGCHDIVASARVLVVDDDPVFREVVRRVLSRADFAVCAEVSDGDEALCAVRRERPDVVLLDINLGRLNGLWALQQIRGVDADVPIIMVTGSRDRATVAAAANLGVQGFLVKPIAPARLIQQITSVVMPQATLMAAGAQ